jgi:tetratricopeptide (TPR) repeat protein
MLENPDQAQYHYRQVDDDQSEWVYDLARERLEHPMDNIGREIMKGRNLTGCREYEKAMQVFHAIGTEIVERNDLYAHKKWSEIRYNISEIRYYQNRYEEALAILDELVRDKSIEDEWFMEWAYYMRGNCHRKLKNYELAHKDYEKAEDTDNRELSARVERAKMRLEQK